jgi:uncharacterized iron-regulated membrane protein
LSGIALKEQFSTWQLWLHHPEQSAFRKVIFHFHFSLGVAVAVYSALMSATGSLIVFRNHVQDWRFMNWLVALHTNLLLGATGRKINGLGAMCLALLCITGLVIWWPGVRNWPRSLTVNWRSRFPRITWDVHSALGIWSLLFVLTWAISAIYFSFPQWFDSLFLLDPSDKITDSALSGLAQLHFGRFNWFTEILWALLGLAPVVLAFTGVFVCCRRVILRKPSNPNRP